MLLRRPARRCPPVGPYHNDKLARISTEFRLGYHGAAGETAMKRPRVTWGFLTILTLPIFAVTALIVVFSFYVTDVWGYVPLEHDGFYSIGLVRGRVEY